MPALEQLVHGDAGETTSPVPLRLTASRGQLGLELYKPLLLPGLQLTALAISLPNLRFPLDLSGGVQVFRHKRGQLHHMQVRVLTRDLLERLQRAWLQTSGGSVERPSLWTSKEALHVGLLTERGALAFDLLWAPDEADGRLIVDNARGAGSVGVPLASAIQLLSSLFGSLAARTGRVFTVANLGAQIARFAFPLVGARAPEVRRGRVSQLRCDADGFAWTIDATLTPPALSEHALRQVELSVLAREGDEALAAGDLDRAREAYLIALERAPRHPQIARLIAEIDLQIGGRNEAALGLLRDTVPLSSGGPVAGELLAEWDMTAARESFDRAIQGEPYAPLAALWAQRLAELEPEPSIRLQTLDRAVALAPALSRVRHARLQARAQLGDVQGVLGDAQHLEAAGQGARVRHDDLSRAARVLLSNGWVRDAGRVFERALRYLPDDPDATAGLARSFLASGQPRRALALLERAVLLSQKGGHLTGDALIDLASVVADELSDLPQAVARVREVPADSPRAHEARALEAHWLATLGDVSGASLAYARLRQALELSPVDDLQQATQWLVKAAHFEQAQSDHLAAERHLAAALRFLPRDPQLQVEYRQAAGLLAAERRARRDDH